MRGATGERNNRWRTRTCDTIPGSEKLDMIVIASRVANKPKLALGIGFGTPVPNMRANARSFDTLRNTLTGEVPANFGATEDRLLRSQRASMLFATVYVPNCTPRSKRNDGDLTNVTGDMNIVLIPLTTAGTSGSKPDALETCRCARGGEGRGREGRRARAQLTMALSTMEIAGETLKALANAAHVSTAIRNARGERSSAAAGPSSGFVINPMVTL
jgi:hypothetical protein